MAEARYLQVITTTDTAAEAEAIAQTLLESKVAACVQITSPVKSYYWWQGKIENADEFVCSIKTTSAQYPNVEDVIKEVHSYDEPEIIAVPITHGSESYLKWIEAEVTGG